VGGSPVDLSAYKDLSKSSSPVASSELDNMDSYNDNNREQPNILGTSSVFSSSLISSAQPVSSVGLNSTLNSPINSSSEVSSAVMTSSAPNLSDRGSFSHSASESYHEIAPQNDAEFTANVKTLIRLMSELPEGVTKQTGAQIIRLTMEAMGISMEDVLSEAQASQSDMLDAVRANIKKIEEYKTVIRKLETDIKFYQGKANELSEIIDLFILSNATPSNRLGQAEGAGNGYNS
jgi:hypothetical protein